MEIEPAKDKFVRAVMDDLVLINKNTGEIIELDSNYTIESKTKRYDLNIQLKESLSNSYSRVTYKNYFLLDKKFLSNLIDSKISMLDLGILLKICCFIDFNTNKLILIDEGVKDLTVQSLADKLDISRYSLGKCLDNLEKLDVVKVVKEGQSKIILSPHFVHKGNKDSVLGNCLYSFKKESSTKRKAQVSVDCIFSKFSKSNFETLGVFACLLALSNYDNLIKQRVKNESLETIKKTLKNKYDIPLDLLSLSLDFLKTERLVAEDKEGVFISPRFTNSNSRLSNVFIEKFEPIPHVRKSIAISPSLVSKEF